jgi:hypothetical protein
VKNVDNVAYKDKFIAFVAILGFKQMVASSEAGTGLSLNELLKMQEELGKFEDWDRIRTHGPTICPFSPFIQHDLDFQLTQISDCVVVSCEVSPAGVINLIGHCWGVVMKLLLKGIMCRGYITRGTVYHNGTRIMGTGYQEAYCREASVKAFSQKADERGTPFVEVDKVVYDYVMNCEDTCVRAMFSRYVKKDGDTSALFPFKRLTHSFLIDETFDPEKEKQSNEDLRQMIRSVKSQVTAFIDNSNHSAVNKAKHYLSVLDAQLAECDETDKAIDMLCSPFSRSRPKR